MSQILVSIRRKYTEIDQNNGIYGIWTTIMTCKNLKRAGLHVKKSTQGSKPRPRVVVFLRIVAEQRPGVNTIIALSQSQRYPYVYADNFGQDSAGESC